MKLSIIVPVFNEEKTVGTVLKRVGDFQLKGVTKEIIVVDDGSTDKTVSEIKKSNPNKHIKFIQHSNNQGKGRAVKTGVGAATGDYIIIQDADLEYNPKDIPRLLTPILEKKAKVVYGTRLNRMPNLTRDERTFQFLVHYFGNRFLSLLTSVLYGQWLTDMETCYKLFPRTALNNIKLNSRGFEFEPEITAKLLKNGYRILEVPISTNPRGYNEGKKLNTIRDGTIALITLFKYRFLN
jgi:dolichol-phosphate mannosyltransferase